MAAIDRLFTIVPPRFINGTAARVTRNMPVRLVSITRFQSSIGNSSTFRLECAVPALLINMSTLRNFFFAPVNIASTEPGSRTSQVSAKTRIPQRASSLTAFFSKDWSRPVMIKSQPSAARAWAMARPIPRLPPVMSATLPCKRVSGAARDTREPVLEVLVLESGIIRLRWLGCG